MNAPQRTRIKFCGLTCAADVALAVEAGAAAGGFITAPCPRRVELELLPELAAAVPSFVTKIGVTVSPGEAEAALLLDLGFTLQFSGDEPAELCERLARGRAYLKAFHVRPLANDAPAPAARGGYLHATGLFDSRVDARYGGTGVPFLWQLVEAAAASRPVVVSGGLTPDNVGACIRSVRPYAVDVRSGIETAGRKDRAKMFAFVRAVREADAEDERRPAAVTSVPR